MCTLESTCRPLCNIGNFPSITLLNILEYTHAKILVIALECQVSCGDTYCEVVSH